MQNQESNVIEALPTPEPPKGEDSVHEHVRHIFRLVQRPHKLNNDYDDMREYAESLESVLRATVDQLKHVEELRGKDCGPIPATLTEGVVRDAEYILSND